MNIWRVKPARIIPIHISIILNLIGSSNLFQIKKSRVGIEIEQQYTIREYINNILEKNDNYCFTFFQYEFSFLFHGIYVYKIRLVEYFKIMFRQKKGEESARIGLFRNMSRENWIIISLVCDAIAFKCYQETKYMDFSFFQFSIHHLGYGECRAPLFLEYVQADIPITVYIWMEHLGPEGNLQANLYRRISQSFLFFEAMIKILRIVTMVESNDF